MTDLTISTRGTENGAPTATVTYKGIYASRPQPNGDLVSLFQDQTNVYSIGRSELQVISRPAVSGVPLQKTNLRLVIPTLEVVAGNDTNGYSAAPKIAYTHQFKGELVGPTRGSVSERWELVARATSAFQQALILALFKDNTQIV